MRGSRRDRAKYTYLDKVDFKGAFSGIKIRGPWGGRTVRLLAQHTEDRFKAQVADRYGHLHAGYSFYYFATDNALKGGRAAYAIEVY